MSGVRGMGRDPSGVEAVETAIGDDPAEVETDVARIVPHSFKAVCPEVRWGRQWALLEPKDVARADETMF